MQAERSAFKRDMAWKTRYTNYNRVSTKSNRRGKPNNMKKETCTRCNRSRREHQSSDASTCDAAYAYVVHDYYGCDSGCCDHSIMLCNSNNKIIERHFEFSHPYGENHQQCAIEWCKHYWPEVPVNLNECKIIEEEC